MSSTVSCCGQCSPAWFSRLHECRLPKRL
jgi:hypothetical protein